ncbi:hypothetical protein [Dactylosporangium salmoneum]|uniref:hypothetical protein n=1 Tax=Dactylosporangium salmoneum TaxID=53361 RepID=UPI0031E31547
MRVRGLLRVLIAGLAAVHVAGQIAGAPVPWTGMVTMLALLAYAWIATDWPTRIGFAALALAAVSVDARCSVDGWPLGLLEGPDAAHRTFEGGLALTGLAWLAAGAVLRRRRSIRRPALVAGVLLALAGLLFVGWARPDRTSTLTRQASGSWVPHTSTPGVVAAGAVRLEIRAESSGTGTRANYVQTVVRDFDVPPRHFRFFGSFDVWDERFSWEEVAPAVPAMLVFAWLAGLAARRAGPEDCFYT